MATSHDDGMDPTEGILADLASLRASREAADRGHEDDPDKLSALDDIAEAAARLREGEPAADHRDDRVDRDHQVGRDEQVNRDDRADGDDRVDMARGTQRGLFFAPFAEDARNTNADPVDVDEDDADQDDSGSGSAPSAPVVDPRNPFSHSSAATPDAYAPLPAPAGGGLLFQAPQEELAQPVDSEWFSDDDGDDDHDADTDDDRDDEETSDDARSSGSDDDGDDDDGRSRSRRRRGGRGRRSRSRDRSSDSGSDDDRSRGSDDRSRGSQPGPDHDEAEHAEGGADSTATSDDDSSGSGDDDGSGGGRRGNRRGRRRRGSGDEGQGQSGTSGDGDSSGSSVEANRDDRTSSDDDQDDSDDDSASSRRRRRRRGRTSRREGGGSSSGSESTGDDQVTAIKGSTRLEAKRQRRREGREAGRRRPLLTEAEFLARRESVSRTMLVREQEGRTQLVVLEDGIAVEHYLSEHKAQASLIGNVYLGRVQNVLPSMEAAFIDIGKGRNAVLYAGEVNWDALGMSGKPHRIEQALSAGDPVLVQVTKDPVGHKGARLTSQISLPGRFLVYIPGNSMTGISRKLPDNERARLKKLLKEILPEKAGVIVRTASEGASDDELRRDVDRLSKRWESIEKKSTAPKASAPRLLYSEPDMIVRIIRDVFNEDFESLVIDGEGAWDTIHEYVEAVAPDLLERVSRYGAEGTSTADSGAAGTDIFDHFRVNEQVEKALNRKVNLPSGGSLVIDRTEAMTVVDVNTGKFTGSGGNLEETVTKNNLEAAEEVIRQLRLRDIGGIIVVDFIDMVLESNRDLVTRRLVECLARDRTRHQVAEVTSLGLVQMTRKRIGTGLAESLAAAGEDLSGRGLMLPGTDEKDSNGSQRNSSRGGRRARSGSDSGSTAGESSKQQSSPVDDEKHNQSRSAVAAIAKATLKKTDDDSSDSGAAVSTEPSGASGDSASRDKDGSSRDSGAGSRDGGDSSSSDGRRSRRRGGRSRNASQDESPKSDSEAPVRSESESPVTAADDTPSKPVDDAPAKTDAEAPAKEPEAWEALVPPEPTGPAPLMIGAETTTSIQTKPKTDAAKPVTPPAEESKAQEPKAEKSTAEDSKAEAAKETAAEPTEEPSLPSGPILMLGMDD
ncbi:Rne/Rng family ribonuclease [Brevibacterium yomogidense]|uniref:Rne/Rng family ribonuclease n=1 Tax=Brevibacterium yomogidense TaxID=946573 RepID=UPI001E2F16EA|nr:Rne/Rng family ribonuclease [Brevibacterium yomogidense]